MNVELFLDRIRRYWTDIDNAVLNMAEPEVLARLRGVTSCDLTIRRMSTAHTGLLINTIVSSLESDECYLNIGTWHGYSLFAGMVGNADKICIGNDNFSLYSGSVGGTGGPDAVGRDFGDPRSFFSSEFERVKGKRSFFHEGDAWDFLDRWKDLFGFPIGFYFYDADHSYECQLRALTAALPYLAPKCAILVDDTNVPHVTQANLDFMKANPEFRMVLDLSTPMNRFPTWWDGLQLMVRE